MFESGSNPKKILWSGSDLMECQNIITREICYDFWSKSIKINPFRRCWIRVRVHMYWVTQKLPQIYTANHAAFPIRIRKITVQICGNFWVTQYVQSCPIKYGKALKKNMQKIELKDWILLLWYSFSKSRVFYANLIFKNAAEFTFSRVRILAMQIQIRERKKIRNKIVSFVVKL